MYFPYGWPVQLQAGGAPHEPYVFLHADQEHVVAVAAGGVQVWAGGAARVRLGEARLSAEDVDSHGTHVAAAWSLERSRLAVLTTGGYIVIYSIRPTHHPPLPITVHGPPGAAGGAPRELSQLTVFARDSVRLPHAAAATAVCGDARRLIVGFEDGQLLSLSWSGKVLSGPVDPLDEDSLLDLTALAFSHWLAGAAAGARAAAIAPPLGLAAVGCASGETLLLRLEPPGGGGGGGEGEPAAAPPHPFSLHSQPSAPEPLPPGGAAPAGAAAAAAAGPGLVRSLHLGDWGHSLARTGGVSALAWSPDFRAVAVGFARQGVAAWTASGCRVLCTVRQQDAARTPRAAGGEPNGGGGARQGAGGGGAGAALDGGVQALAWGALGYSLLVAGSAAAGGGGGGTSGGGSGGGAPDDAGGPPAARADSSASAGGGGGGGGCGSLLVELQLAKSLACNHRVSQGADRILLITDTAPLAGRALASGAAAFGPAGAGGDSAAAAAAAAGGAANDLSVLHVPLPAGYAAANWPLVHAAASADGGDVAVSGRRGLAVFSVAAGRWRLFGDVSHERRVAAAALGWLGGCVVVASAPGSDPAAAAAAPPSGRPRTPGGGGGAGGGGGGGSCVLVFPKRHLDFGSLVASYELKRPPIAMDCAGHHVLVACGPLDLLLLQLDAPHAALVPVRELSIFNPGRPLLGLAVVPPQAGLGPGGGGGGPLGARPSGTLASLGSGGLDLGGGGGGGGGASEEDAEAAALSKALARGAAAPQHAVLLRWGGALSVLDLDRGSELLLSNEIECFWLSTRLPVGPPAAGGAPGSRGGSGAGSAAPSRGGSMHALQAAHGPLAAAESAAAAGGALALREALGAMQLRHAEAALASGGLLADGAGGGAAAAAAAAEAFAAQQQHQQDAAMVEMPWWAYGPGGMQLWFPSLLPPPALAPAGSAGGPPLAQLHPQASLTLIASPTAAAAAAAAAAPGAATAAAAAAAAAAAVAAAAAAAVNGGGTDIELEFDREVYPIGVSLADASIVGVTQRLMRGEPALALPSFHPAPESQPVLPALLRRLLQKGAAAEALALAKRHEAGPHFARSLEWLLFTALDMEGGILEHGARRGAAAEQGALGPLNKARARGRARAGADAARACGGRTCTDAALWPALFTAVGSPAALLQHLLESGALMSAACFLIVVDRLESSPLAQGLALRLVRLTLRRAQYGLAAEILRFTLPPAWKAPTPEPAAAPAAPGGGGGGKGAPQVARSASTGWLGWLWGGGGGGGGGQEPKQRLRARVSGDAAGGDGGGADGWAGPPAAGRMGSRLAAGGTGGGAEIAEEACLLVSDHAWMLLEQAKLAQLAQLLAAMSFLPAGLRGLMAAHRGAPAAPAPAGAGAEWWAAGGEAPPAPEDLADAVVAAVGELPVWEGPGVEEDAAAVLALCRALGAAKWAAALGVLLADMPTLAPFAAAHPGLWAGACGRLRARPELRFMGDLLDALAPPPAPADAAPTAAAAPAEPGAAEPKAAAAGGEGGAPGGAEPGAASVDGGGGGPAGEAPPAAGGAAAE
ncbi:MAG: hypothetical protein J3K34DRAFT_462531 [Monoraphidium minutum]|nr:MAG: hypothetical protein J3K34DRAFT_462531 [Monoraphidium minutum]